MVLRARAGRRAPRGPPGRGGVAGAPTAQALLDKAATCGGAAIQGGFGLDGSGSISIYSCSGALYWKADLDVDCDGTQTAPCNTDTTGQPQTSIKWVAPNLQDVDPTKLPYIVIPLGSAGTTWYTAYGGTVGSGGSGHLPGKGRLWDLRR